MITDLILFRGLVGSFRRGQEEVSIRVLTELVNQHTKTAFGVAESSGRFLAGESFDKVGSQGFILSGGGVCRPIQLDFLMNCLTCSHHLINPLLCKAKSDVSPKSLNISCFWTYRPPTYFV